MLVFGATLGAMVGAGLRFLVDVAAAATPSLTTFVLTGSLFVIGICGVVFAGFVYMYRRWPELDFRPDFAAYFGTPPPRKPDAKAWLANIGPLALTGVAFAIASFALIPNRALALVAIAAALVVHLAFLAVWALVWPDDY